MILVLVMGIITTMQHKKTLESELEKRGLALACDLAKFTARPLLNHNLPTLRRFINHTMDQDYVLYAMVLDPLGKIVMHSDLVEVNKTYTDRLSVIAVNSKEPGYTSRHLSKDKELHCDIFSPIQVAGIRLGTIRLGYSYIALEKVIDKARRQIFLIGLATTILGGIIAYLLATFISWPIKRITEATEKVAEGCLNTPLMIKRNDEIGALANAFNNMIEDLQKTTVSRDYVDNIIGSMNETLIVLDPEAKIKTVNRATCDLLGYKEAELVGQNIDKIVSEKVNFFTGSGFRRLLEEKTVMNHEADYITARGKHISMLFSAATLKNKERIAGAVIIARDVTERKQAEEALRKSEKELHFLSSQLLTAQERERRRLSRELHDELGQGLIVLKLKFRSIQDALHKDQIKLKEECDEAIDYINEVTENVHRLSRDLSPSILEDLGLTAAIRRLVESFTKHSNIKCMLDVKAADDLFSQEGQIILYRIVQECLTNVAKHAQATKASIVIRKQGDRVFFRVKDNGIGFNFQEIAYEETGKKGLGLAAMYERARMLGGSLDIWSREGAGARIAITIPLNEGAYL